MTRFAARIVRWVALGVMLALGGARTLGAEGGVAGSSAIAATRGELDGADSHGWMVIDGETSLLRQTRSWLIVHVPPRRAVHEDGVSRGGAEGSVRQILPAIQENPVALAAWGDVLYVISETSSSFPRAQRQVGSVRVVPTGVGEYWVSQPTHRLQPRAGLAGGGEILGAVGTAAGPMVLVAREGAVGKPASVWLRVLYQGAWRELVLAEDLRRLVQDEGRLPTNEAKGGRWWRLMATRDGVEIWSARYGEERGRVWRLAEVVGSIERAMNGAAAKIGEADGAEDDAALEGKGVRARRRLERERRADDVGRLENVRRLQVEWPGADVALPREATDSIVPPRVLNVGGLVVVVGWKSAGEAIAVSRVGMGWRELWRGAVPSGAGVIAMPGSGRLAFAWPTGLFNTAGYGLQMVEVSVNSGREMFAGRAVSVSPVSSTDLRFLAVFLLGASAAVLLFVLKSEAADKAFHLPEGTALAEGWRRGLATMIDLFVSLMVAAEVQGVDLSESMSVSGWMTGKGLPVMLMGLGIACVTCTVFERLWGRSLGKMLAGCEVVDVSRVVEAGGEEEEAELPRPTLVRSLVRNGIKWGFPPVGMFMVLDAAGRHPGDVFGKTAVVCWQPEEEDEGM